MLVTAIMLGSIGVTSFEHACSKNGVSISYFIPESHHCKEEKKTATHKKKSCCATSSVFNATETSVEEKPCCSNAVDYVYLDSDRTNTSASQLELYFEEVNFQAPSYVSFDLDFNNTTYRGPPPSTILVRLAKLQTYII